MANIASTVHDRRGEHQDIPTARSGPTTLPPKRDAATTTTDCTREWTRRRSGARLGLALPIRVQQVVDHGRSSKGGGTKRNESGLRNDQGVRLCRGLT